MNKDSRNSDFNLFLASDALLGTLEAIYELMADIPAEGTTEHTQWTNALTGLAWIGRQVARDANAFLTEASDMHRFPATWKQIKVDDSSPPREVRESAAIYVIR